ncbi:MAG: 2-oxoglutarate dehydrogenase E1 component [Pseudomonadota bacterium]
MNHNFDFSSYLYSANAAFIFELYEKFLHDPTLVDEKWQAFFVELGDDIHQIISEYRGPSWAKKQQNYEIYEDETEEDSSTDVGGNASLDLTNIDVNRACGDSIGALMLIRSYRMRGHLRADTDPLKLMERSDCVDLDPKTYGFTEADYDREIYLGGSLGIQYATLRQILAKLNKIYCSNIGSEFMHIESLEEREWLESKIETVLYNDVVPADNKVAALKKMIEVELFENFLHVKFPGTKRFSIEGGESTICAMESVISTEADSGVKEVIIGMAHRGRLNVLTSVMGKSYHAMLAEFQGALAHPETLKIAGDVKYHLGTSSDKIFGDNDNVVHVSLTANPSHLEAVNPVVVGKVRAKQNVIGDDNRDKVMSILLHGDAAFAGQGVVAETLLLGDLKGYNTGGTVHIIINNQIGFTTSPKNARLSPYPTEVAKMVQAPIFHVNGNDPDAVIAVSKIATEFRRKFKKDVVVDIICYRKYGHNEGDEPMFTQPLMYKNIKQMSSPMNVYAKKLIANGVITEEKFKSLVEDFEKFMENEFNLAANYQQNKADWLEGRWAGLHRPEGGVKKIIDTGIDKNLFLEIGNKLSSVSESIVINKKLSRQFDNKKKNIENGKNIDWATAEALAFGSLLLEGNPIRMSGQDVCRGTFSQRHAVIIDQETEERYIALNNLSDLQECNIEIIDSNLSEFAVLGFEYGYSLVNPKCLTLWEAQFGDFANGAQVIIDQFISSAEHKWLRMSGIVLLLPHGYEGQGPEHSSARLERFLQLCADDNIQVANCSTPANYFHILRRQVKRNFRKPLVMMTPKSLLRNRLCVSNIEDFTTGSNFQRVIPETDKLVAADKVRKLVLCTGKVYYDLYEKRQEHKINDVALVRVEQIYPYPLNEVADIVKKYKNAEVVWCQEEPQNMGAWHFLDRRIEESMQIAKSKFTRPKYIGRSESASPSVGYMKLHLQELENFVKQVFDL